MGQLRAPFRIALWIVTGVLLLSVALGAVLKQINARQIARNDAAAAALAEVGWPKKFTGHRTSCVDTRGLTCLRVREPADVAARDVVEMLDIQHPVFASNQGLQGLDVTVHGTFHGVPISVGSYTRDEFPDGHTPVAFSWIDISLNLSTILTTPPGG
jgi:hypothetical protein